MNLPTWPTAATATVPPSASPSAPAWLPADTGFALPDGTPLLLTISRKSLYVQLTQSVTVAMPDEAILLLYLCTPGFDPAAIWRTPAPSDDTPDPDMRETQPDRFTAIRTAAEAWADRTFHHTQLMPLWELALALWNDSHSTATVPMETDTTADAGEKKSMPAPSPTGASNTSASSPEETSSTAPGSSTPSPSATPTPPSTPGPSSQDSPSSPPPSNPPASPAQTPSSPPPSAPPAATCDFCIPGTDNCTHPNATAS